MLSRLHTVRETKRVNETKRSQNVSVDSFEELMKVVSKKKLPDSDLLYHARSVLEQVNIYANELHEWDNQIIPTGTLFAVTMVLFLGLIIAGLSEWENRVNSVGLFLAAIAIMASYTSMGKTLEEPWPLDSIKKLKKVHKIAARLQFDPIANTLCKYDVKDFLIYRQKEINQMIRNIESKEQDKRIFLCGIFKPKPRTALQTFAQDPLFDKNVIKLIFHFMDQLSFPHFVNEKIIIDQVNDRMTNKRGSA